METVKLLEENLRKMILDMGLGDDFLDITPKAQDIETKINTRDNKKLKSFCIVKESMK